MLEPDFDTALAGLAGVGLASGSAAGFSAAGFSAAGSSAGFSSAGLAAGFGGFLGVGEKFHPIPWDLLDYDEEFGGYAIGLTKEQLMAAPSDSIEELTKDSGYAYRDRAFDYYKTPRYWETRTH